MAFAHLLEQALLIGNGFERIRIIAHQHPSVHTPGNGSHPLLQDLGIFTG